METLQAEVRTGSGKGPARQLRMRGLIPAVFYGPGVAPTGLAVAPKEVRRVLSTDKGRNAIVKIAFDGREELAICKDVQIHPVDREPLHVDFYRVELDRPVSVLVPLVTKGKAVGVSKGGELHIVLRQLPVRSLPEKIPAKIEVDITNLELHQTIPVKDLALPEGVTVMLAPDRTIVAVQTEKKQIEEEVAPVAGAAAAVAPGAEGAAAGAVPGAAPGAAAPAKEKKEKEK